jgi:phosphoribosylformylglycinamidine cyclo-ligase
VVAAIDAKSWTMPKLFQWLQKEGNVDAQEMYRTFNCGVGMVVIMAADQAAAAIALLEAEGETVYTLGTIRARVGDEHQTQVA